MNTDGRELKNRHTISHGLSQASPAMVMVLLGCFLSVVLLGASADGLILHPLGEPNASWTDRPANSIVAKWTGNASCVVISANYVLTTRHQIDSGVGTPLYIDVDNDGTLESGETFEVAAVWTEPTGPADIRVCRIETQAGGPANLSQWVQPYPEPNEVGNPIVMGGYGQGRSTVYSDRYAWDGGANTTQRWGQNVIDGTTFIDTDDYDSDVIVLDFDPLGVGGARPYEAAIAMFDSGGGWFIKHGGEWKVAGLSRGVGHMDETYFTPADYNDAVCVSSYATWVNSVVQEPVCTAPVTGDLNGDCMVNMEDLAVVASAWLRSDCEKANEWCSGADVYGPDGLVDLNDFAVLSHHWQDCNLDLTWGCE